MKKIIKYFLLSLFLFSTNLFSSQTEKIKLQLQWKHQFEFAGFYAAIEKGYYKELGLDVDLIEFSNDVDVFKKVLNEKNTYAITYSDLMLEYLKGKPLKFIGNFFKKSPLVLATQKDIDNPRKLVNKKIMGISQQVSSLMFLSVYKKYGITSNDFISIPHTFNINDFTNKNVDAITIFTTNELYFLDQMNYPYNIVDPNIHGAMFYDLNLFTSQEEYINNPKRVNDFFNATVKGWEYALNNKEEIVSLILKKYNTQNKTKESLLYEANKIEEIFMRNVYPVGSIDKNRVNLIFDSFINNGIAINKSKINLDEFIFEKPRISLDETQMKYLSSKKEIKVCIHPFWYPFESFDENMNNIGLTNEYLNLFSKELKKSFTIVPTKTWRQSLDFVSTNECDILSLDVSSFERHDYLKYTIPYFDSELVMVGKDTEPFYGNLQDMGEKTIGICKNFKFDKKLKSKYPKIKFVTVENYIEGFELLKSDKIYGYVNALPVLSHYLQKSYQNGYKLINKLEEKIEFSVAVNQENELLVPILDKLIKKIPKEETQKIKNRYLIHVVEKEDDFTLFKIIIVIIIFFLMYILFRYYLLKKITNSLENKIKNELEKSKEKDDMIFHQNKLIAMGEMIENISHQWKQPLNEVNGSILLIDEELSKLKISNVIISENIDNIENLASYMGETINDFRKFYSPEKELEKFKVSEILDKTLEIIKHSFKDKQINIIKNYQDNFYLESYPNELKQVLLSIFNNAKDAFLDSNCEDKKLFINTEETDDTVIIYIEDNAGGIDEKIIKKIFNPYFTTKKFKNGTGLGLYISKMIVENNLNGKLLVNSINNKTIFKIILNKNNKKLSI